MPQRKDQRDRRGQARRLPSPEQMPSGRWRVRYRDPDGERKSSTFDTLDEANGFIAQVHVAIQQGRYIAPDRGKRTFGDWAAEYFEVSAPLLRENTVARDLTVYRLYVEPRWGSVPLASIARPDVAKWVAGLSDPAKTPSNRTGGALAPRTVAKVYATFRKIIRAAVYEDLMANPLPRKPAVPPAARKTERYLSADDVARLADAIPDRYQALIWLCCYGGLRIGEAAALRVGDIDWRRFRIRVDETQTEMGGRVRYNAPKTKSGYRVVPVADAVIEELRRHVETYVGFGRPDALVFQSPTGEVLRVNNWRRRVFASAVEAAGLERMTPHDMRHTAAAGFISEGANRWQLASNLGHKDTRMIDEVYSHLFDEDQEALRERMSIRAREGRANVVPIRKAQG